MDTSLTRALTRLPKGTLLRVSDSRGKGVAVFQGRAWVTQDGDSRDVVIGAGESFALDRPGMAIVQALDDTNLLVFETRPAGVLAVRGVDASAGRSRAWSDAEVLEVGPPTSYELQHQARRNRHQAMARAARALVEHSRLLWIRLWAPA
jgi:hypothetical protein